MTTNNPCVNCTNNGSDLTPLCYASPGTQAFTHKVAGDPCPNFAPKGPLLKVKRLCTESKLPAYQTAGAAGLDLHSIHELPIHPGERTAFGTGIAVEIPPGFEGQVRPRSSLTAMGLVLPTGTIDSDYRGEIRVVLINTSREVRYVKAGDRIAQLVIAPVARCEVVEVEELSSTERGSGGFGSTGR